jgi:hypothetical protein
MNKQKILDIVNNKDIRATVFFVVVVLCLVGAAMWLAS